MMSLWVEFVRSRRFWLNYLKAGVDLSRSPSLSADAHSPTDEPSCGATVCYSLPSLPDDFYLLRLEINDGEHRLFLYGSEWPDDKPRTFDLQLGNMDCHQMSDAFRWEEFQSLMPKISRRNGGPSWAHELLLSFYVAVTEECADQCLALQRRCLTESGLFTEDEVEYIIAYNRRVAVRKDFRWVHQERIGWVAEGKNAYSVRNTRWDGFDFSAMERFLRVLAAHPEPGAAADGGRNSGCS